MSDIPTVLEAAYTDLRAANERLLVDMKRQTGDYAEAALAYSVEVDTITAENKRLKEIEAAGSALTETIDESIRSGWQEILPDSIMNSLDNLRASLEAE